MSLIERLLGRTLSSQEESTQKITPLAGVPILGLDALSSAAYGPEAALTVLLAIGALGLNVIGPITLAVVALLFIVYLSYRQTIAAYPQGGGSYTVARENLGVGAGLLAGAALILDYVLNVAVGISAGVGAVASAFPALLPLRVELCLVLLIVIAFVNLRGLRESGAAFMLPTLLFVVVLVGVIVVGVVKTVLAGGAPVAVVAPPGVLAAGASGGLSLWLIVRAFSAGCTAMTGVEAVSNGVPNFRDPAPRNAQLSLSYIVGILALLLAGVAYLSRAYHISAIDPASPAYQSVLTMLVAAVTGKGVVYFLSVFAILLVLCLSANTSFADLPRVAKLLAQDNYLPHAFASRGRRLVYTSGIVALTLLAGLLLVVFGGVTDRLIPLFAIGAFLAFTLSQAGMVTHWRRLGRGGAPLALNLVGAVATGVTLLVILVSKFTDGAWATLVLIPALLLVFTLTRRHYDSVRVQVGTDEALDYSPRVAPVVIVPIQDWTAVTRKALRFAMKVGGDVRAVHVQIEGSGTQLTGVWATLVERPAQAHGATAPKLVLLASPYRRLLEPLSDYIRAAEQEVPAGQVVVIIPELISTRWYHSFLHNARSTALKAKLYFGGDRRVVVINVPWYLDE
ncbi:APC family permease [Deinococcus altitudinis]|uniref:APC family permease n=1 Tax=Deinococcus altitudinis TaxID=468914 RepID=UPI0038914098